jgi:two-component system, cell cycle sensor histidine kinase and response regulator CckA
VNHDFGARGDDGRDPQAARMESILVLDDDAANLQGIADVLRSEHYSVVEASTGLQAIENGKSCGPISLFVTDMDLPRSSGTDIALKLVASNPNLPVLFISGTPMGWWTSRDVSNFKRFPPNRVDFIEKPFSLSQLLAKVRNLIGRTSQLRTERGFQAA